MALPQFTFFVRRILKFSRKIKPIWYPLQHAGSFVQIFYLVLMKSADLTIKENSYIYMNLEEPDSLLAKLNEEGGLIGCVYKSPGSSDRMCI